MKTAKNRVYGPSDFNRQERQERQGFLEFCVGVLTAPWFLTTVYWILNSEFCPLILTAKNAKNAKFFRVLRWGVDCPHAKGEHYTTRTPQKPDRGSEIGDWGFGIPFSPLTP
jgi:hypothetical protein